jgi:hypothetical protein
LTAVRLGSLLLVVLSRCWRSAASLSVLAALQGTILDARSLVALGSARLAELCWALLCASLLAPARLARLALLARCSSPGCSTLGSLQAADRFSFLAGCSARSRIVLDSLSVLIVTHALASAGSDRLGSSPALGSPAVCCCSARLAVCC